MCVHVATIPKQVSRQWLLKMCICSGHIYFDYAVEPTIDYWCLCLSRLSKTHCKEATFNSRQGWESLFIYFFYLFLGRKFQLSWRTNNYRRFFSCTFQNSASYSKWLCVVSYLCMCFSPGSVCRKSPEGRKSCTRRFASSRSSPSAWRTAACRTGSHCSRNRSDSHPAGTLSSHQISLLTGGKDALKFIWVRWNGQYEQNTLASRTSECFQG